jgi:hypothetical protein
MKALEFFCDLHLCEQKRTSSHVFSHFFRHVNGRPQLAHILLGRSDFLRILAIKNQTPVVLGPFFWTGIYAGAWVLFDLRVFR